MINVDSYFVRRAVRLLCIQFVSITKKVYLQTTKERWGGFVTDGMNR